MELIFLAIVIVLLIPRAYKAFMKKKRDFTNYPVFSEELILEAKEEAEEEREKVTREWTEISKKLEKSRSVKVNRDHNQEIKSEVKDYFIREVDLLYEERKTKLMIEANIAVKNGKSIEEAEKCFKDKDDSSISGKVNKGYEVYAAWEKDTPNKSKYTTEAFENLWR